ncbi:transporter substrate-binding domain-containing protein [Virgibacillus oceani]|uniref:Cystine ABC transporter substrate-binding protein n=1 Tax=Virgibacillus oceani TaxID=1479511 RepID=A0A917HI68_9BACI|nr:transporter substrate-binding domain-containing protein [Virgibacillus oceani]GGG79823.1 cystine ABC transporter substrate-binding protein [Virgibacillus oceani]
MKGFAKVTVFLLLLIVAAACSSNEKASGNEDQNVLERVEDSGVLRVGFEGTYQPFNYLDDNNEYAGFDVDIANELADRLGVETEFIATKWDSLIGGLKADKFDIIIAQMTVTEERKKSVDFTDPYVVTGSVLITREDDSADISKLEDIKGKKVGVGGGTTFEEVARSVDGADVTLYKSVTDYIQDLINGRLDVIINDQLLMSYNIKEEGLPIKIVSDVVNKDEIGMAVKNGSDEFVEKINKELAGMIEDGTYNEIYKKWFDSEPLVK